MRPTYDQPGGVPPSIQLRAVDLLVFPLIGFINELFLQTGARITEMLTQRLTGGAVGPIAQRLRVSESIPRPTSLNNPQRRKKHA